LRNVRSGPFELVDNPKACGYPGLRPDILGLVAKVLVSFDDALLRRVDQTAKARGLSRSAYLAGLAEQDTIRSAPGTTRAAHRALSRLDHLLAGSPAEESTIAIRAARDAR